MLKRIMDYWVEILIALVVLVLVGFGFWFFNMINASGASVKEKAVAQAGIAQAAEMAPYDNETVMGSEVLNAAQLFKDRPQFSVLIKTGNATAGFYAENTSSVTPPCYAATSPLGAPGTCAAMVTLSQMKDQTNIQNYINKTALFNAKIYMDASNEVHLIEFIQR